MDFYYWLGEYLKVFAGYIFILYIWPSVVFRRGLRGKGMAYRFAFCTTAQIMVLNTLVITLGIFHILKPLVFRVLFMGIFAFSILKDVKITEKQKRSFKYLVTGTLGTKNFFLKIAQGIRRGFRNLVKWFWGVIKGHIWEYTLLSAVILYGMIYFTYGAFQLYSFGTGDVYVHASWIYELTQGNIFSNGVYPEGMHCFVYAVQTLFGLRLYSCMIFLGCIHVSTILISAYLFLRSVFRWNYTPLLAMTLFLVLDHANIDMVAIFARLQWTIPMEFAFHTIFLCTIYLLKFVRDEKKEIRSAKKGFFRVIRKIYADENLLIFTLAVAASFAVHFYVTIMLIFMCAAFVPFMMKKLLRPKKLIPLIAAGICALTISTVPMAAAYISGVPLEGSLYWAMSVITKGRNKGTENTQTPETVTPSADRQDTGESSGEGEGGTGKEAGNTAIAIAGEGSGTENTQSDILVQLQGYFDRMKNRMDKPYQWNYVSLYRDDAPTLVKIMGLCICIWLAYGVIITLLHIFPKCRKIPIDYFYGYPGLILASVIYTLLYIPGAMGLPTIVEGTRLLAITQLLNMGMIVIPIDFVFAGLDLFMPKFILKGAALIQIAGICFMVVTADRYHGYLCYLMTRYNSEVETTLSITRKFPYQAYTVISTTDDLYQLLPYGWHEEQVRFVNETTEPGYTIPSKYVIIYVEKKPIFRSQYHFFSGPAWLACDKYRIGATSVGDEVLHDEISEEDIADPEEKYIENTNAYSVLQVRTIMQATTLDWCEKFESVYPGELKVYYEDDDFVCYYFKQNVNRLYDLGIR